MRVRREQQQGRALFSALFVASSPPPLERLRARTCRVAREVGRRQEERRSRFQRWLCRRERQARRAPLRSRPARDASLARSTERADGLSLVLLEVRRDSAVSLTLSSTLRCRGFGRLLHRCLTEGPEGLPCGLASAGP